MVPRPRAYTEESHQRVTNDLANERIANLRSVHMVISKLLPSPIGLSHCGVIAGRRRYLYCRGRERARRV